jgi:hypothetical protein
MLLVVNNNAGQDTKDRVFIADCRLTECCGTSSAVRKQSAIGNRKSKIDNFLLSIF